MEQWFAIAVVAAGLAALGILSALRRSRERRQRGEQRRLELILQEKETVKVICPQRKGRCILTSQRLIFDDPSGIHAVTLRSISQLQGYTQQGRKTSVPEKMAKLTVSAKQEYTVENTGEAFLELAKPLLDKMKRQKDRKKAKEAAKGNNRP